MAAKCVRVLFFPYTDKEQDLPLWIGQGLEYDIVAQGDSIQQVEERFINTLIAQGLIDMRHGKDVFEGIEKAPDEYWELFEKGYAVELKSERGPAIDLSEYELVWPRQDETSLEELPQKDMTEFLPTIEEARVHG